MLQILPFLPQSLDAAFEIMKPENINQGSLDGCNNAVWFVGVVSKMCSPEDVIQYALLGLERMYPLLTSPIGTLPRSLVENAAVCLGRIARSSGDAIAKHITPAFLTAWCSALRGLRDGEEKIDAYEGLCKVVKLNPDIGLSQFGSICECFASWTSIPEQGGLKLQMSEILEQFGSYLVSTGKWEDFTRGISPAVLRKLHMAK
jgi:transportin-1